MAVYFVTTPSEPRLVKAITPSSAITYAMGEDGYGAKALSATELAEYLEKGFKIETVKAAGSKAA